MKGRTLMEHKTYFWIEDREGKSGYIFWETFMKQLCPEVLVESKKNNSELVKAVKGLEDTENRYIICFEYLLLEFKDLISWIYAPDDEFLTKRRKAITARDKLVSMIATGELDYKDIKEIIDYNEAVDSYNIEQLSAKTLFDLTRNTGFEVSKGSIGECWIKSCCEWQNRMEDDVCGLDKGNYQLMRK
jgi:hypothetical protein